MRIKGIATLLALVLLLLLSPLSSDSVYFYHGSDEIATVNVLDAYPNFYFYYYFYNSSLLSIVSSDSTVNYGNNVSIDIIQYILTPINYTYDVGNTTYITLPKGSKVILIPLVYSAITYGNKLSYSCLSLIFCSPSGAYKAVLISNSEIVNTSYYFIASCPHYEVNVSFSLTCPLVLHDSVSILLALLVEEGNGVYYFYFWNVSITSFSL
ncbi:hypothetical protein [Acidianus sp. HS-5]|uniref:hypothetical protein n=1 Tax=Acidianus sp. HS-5 TaxID=2886040 RepID=UPI001F1B5DDE|nr:hypothetical protein [Acidianus sp. HS-5]